MAENSKNSATDIYIKNINFLISVHLVPKMEQINQQYCVKSNGASIQSDLNIYFIEPGNYILFLDDINKINRVKMVI